MKRLLAIFLFVLLTAGLGACGGGGDDATVAAQKPAPAQEEPASSSEFETPTTKQGYPLMDDGIFDAHVRYAADPEGALAFFISEASASPGKIGFQFVNPQKVPHNVALEAPNGKTIGETETIKEGATTAHFVVKPGEYVLYCAVPGHRQAGMIGHLTVK